MKRPASLSVVLLPTLACNASCDYCFEEKNTIHLALEDVPIVAVALLNYMVERGVERAEIYWQGGEVMLLGPSWLASAGHLMDELASRRGLFFNHFLQTNLIGYTRDWNPLIERMFGNTVGTSMDFPNLHRRLRHGGTEAYTQAWKRAVWEARSAGINAGVIAVVHEGSLEAGPDAFYEFFADEMGLTDFQVNTPFPGGPGEGAGPLDPRELSGFLVRLLEIFMERGWGRGVRVAPFSALIDLFSGRQAQLPCIWQPNCANEFLSIDPRGEVALCDCWVTSYPDFHFGNIFKSRGLGELLAASAVRRTFLERPGRVMEREDCLSCEHLSLCHGGCPIRTFTARGTILAKDPYCEVYKAVFSRARELAGSMAEGAR